MDGPALSQWATSFFCRRNWDTFIHSPDGEEEPFRPVTFLLQEEVWRRGHVPKKVFSETKNPFNLRMGGKTRTGKACISIARNGG